MDRNTFRVTNAAQILTQAFPEALSSDTVVISIYDLDDNASDVSASAMTYETGVAWSYAWTPTEAHFYLISYTNTTQNVSHYEYVSVVGQVTGTPSAGLVGSTLTTLRSKFLRLIDNYNANDLSGTNSSGDVADLCINDALQTIYATIKASRHLEAYGSTGLVSTASQSYIELSAITDVDEIVAIKDTTNQWTLKPITPEQYFRRVSNPAGVTGIPKEYCRIYNRVYLNPRPTSAITYTTEYRKTYPALASGSDQALIPSKYDPWIMAEARVIWLMGEDPNAVAAIQMAQKERERCEDKFMNDIFSNFDYIPQGASHFLENEDRGWLPYDHPMDGA